MNLLVEPKNGGISTLGDEVTWHTFAGGRINSTLRYALTSLEPNWSVTPDNFSIRASDSNLTEAHFWMVVQKLRVPELWEDESLW